MSKKCIYCGAELEDDALFCDECGKKQELSKEAETEQNALKYQSDLLSAFNVKSQVMPFQNISMYETVSPNLYDYAQQKSKPDAPQPLHFSMREYAQQAYLYRKRQGGHS